MNHNHDIIIKEIPTATRRISTPASSIRNSSGTNGVSTTTTPASHHAAFTLPDGRIMDAKNTLQSFDGALCSGRVAMNMPDDSASTTCTPSASNSNTGSSETKVTTPLSRPPFTLPDGRIMDSKNTLQSFDVTNSTRYEVAAATYHQKLNTDHPIQPSSPPGVAMNTYSYNSNNIYNDDNTREENMIPVQAIAVRSMAVTIEAEPYFEPERVSSMSTIQKVMPEQRTKQGLSRFVVTIIILLLGAGISVGTYCGTGHCSVVHEQNDPQSLRSTNTTDTAQGVTTTTPSTTAIDPLMVACNFLSMSDLSECQTTTSFHGITMGDTIPSEIGLLTQLQMLDFLEQELVGTIPSTMGNLIHLTALYLYVNQLTGTIPSTLGNLVRLTGLYLAKNQLSGSIPSSFGNLVELNYLYLYGNQLTGTLPSTLRNLVQVQDISLSGNKLSGTLPTNTLENLGKLQILVIDNNHFTGSLPSLLGSMTRLTYLGMANNALVGTIPSTVSNLVQLTQLDLYGNEALSGTVPSSLCSVSDIKIGIDCDGNIICSCCYERLTNSLCL